MEKDEGRGLRAKWRGLSFEAKVTAFVAPLLVFAVTFTVERVLSDGGGGDSAETSERSARRGSLEVVDVRSSESDVAGAVELVVRNTGGTVSVITEAEFRVRDIVSPNASGCSSGCPPGSPACNLGVNTNTIDLSGSYDVAIPSEDAIGSVMSVAVNQQIRSDEADRFSFDVGIEGTDEGPATARAPALYLIDVAIRHDGEPEALRAGLLLLGIPLEDPNCAFWSDEQVEELRRKARKAEQSPALAELISSLSD